MSGWTNPEWRTYRVSLTAVSVPRSLHAPAIRRRVTVQATGYGMAVGLAIAEAKWPLSSIEVVKVTIKVVPA